ncbi:MAG: hypothetical protein AAGF83_12030 [Cyanobacteria bacterium P01_G01_bin.67]
MNEDRLYNLLPAVYRLRDSERGEPLKALLNVINQEVNVVEADIQQLYENWFIETCQDWVVPYIGDLVGYRPIQEIVETNNLNTVQDKLLRQIAIPRREVANTLRYRRRKGTLYLLELLAKDVSDWSARVVEYYKLLSWNQSLNHLSFDPSDYSESNLISRSTVNLRQKEELKNINGPFDKIAHTADIRAINSRKNPGRYNLPNIGVFIWRLNPYKISDSVAHPVDIGDRSTGICPSRYKFSVLGNDIPLYQYPEPESDLTNIADEINLPVQISRQALKNDFEDFLEKKEKFPKYKEKSSKYYGKDKSFAIYAPEWLRRYREGDETEDLILVKDDDPIPVRYLEVKNLSNWQSIVQEDKIAIDPGLGRIAFPQNKPLAISNQCDSPQNENNQCDVRVTYHYAFSAKIGGGEYERPLITLDKNLLLSECSFTGSVESFISRNVLSTSDSDTNTPRGKLINFIKGKFSERFKKAEDSFNILNDIIQSDNIFNLIQEFGSDIFDALELNRLDRSGRNNLEKKISILNNLNGFNLQGKELIYFNRLTSETFLSSINILKTLFIRYEVSKAYTELKELKDNQPYTIWECPTINDAITLRERHSPTNAVIEILDSNTYVEQLCPIVLTSNQVIQIRAANKKRPTICNPESCDTDVLRVFVKNGSRFYLDGILITGRGISIQNTEPIFLNCQDDDAQEAANKSETVQNCTDPENLIPSKVTIRHSTLVPGWVLRENSEALCIKNPSIKIINKDVNIPIQLTIEKSILGPIHFDQNQVKTLPTPITISDSIVDAVGVEHEHTAIGSQQMTKAHASLSLLRSTILGRVEIHAIEIAENSIFNDLVHVARSQIGCVRFCYVAPESRTPRRYRCQPDLVEKEFISSSENERDAEIKRVRPKFNSRNYGKPSYCQLADDCAIEIKRGAEDESEMGVFHDLFQPQRESNLRTRLEEYTAVGMEVGIIFVN